MIPYIVLSTTYPAKHLKAWEIGRGLAQLTKMAGLIPLPVIGGKVNSKAAWNKDSLHAEVRLTCSSDAEGATWHQDGDNTPGAEMKHILALWADRMPTQFLFRDKIYQPEPYELVVVYNLTCYHRRPPEANGLRRSFRQRLSLDGANLELP